MPHVSITGLTVRRRWHRPRFWWHAVRSLSQARAAPGCLMAEARTVGGVHHTLSIWQDRAALRSFMTTGAHLAAMRDFRRIGTGRTFGYDADSAPAWPEALDLWHRHARAV
jgi:quinol monooxygenase YgiN